MILATMMKVKSPSHLLLFNNKKSRIIRRNQKNQGKLLIDATCVSVEIAYPTDPGLLNHAREKLENMIDTLHEPFRGKQKKPRIYRIKARKAYLLVAEQRKPRKKALKKAISQQLSFVERDLKYIEKLVKQSDLIGLSKEQYRDLFVIQ